MPSDEDYWPPKKIDLPSIVEGGGPELEAAVRKYGENLTKWNGSACSPFSTAPLPGREFRLVVFQCDNEPHIVVFHHSGGKWIGYETVLADVEEESEI